MNSEESSSSQFTIKRLFWMLIVASVAFKLADLSGVFRMVSSSWNLSQGAGRGQIFTSILVFALIAMAYIVWIGIRLPWLIDRFRSIRHKRRQRQQRLRDQYETLRKEDNSLRN